MATLRHLGNAIRALLTPLQQTQLDLVHADLAPERIDAAKQPPYNDEWEDPAILGNPRRCTHCDE